MHALRECDDAGTATAGEPKPCSLLDPLPQTVTLGVEEPLHALDGGNQIARGGRRKLFNEMENDALDAGALRDQQVARVNADAPARRTQPRPARAREHRGPWPYFIGKWVWHRTH
jgi:hypothetical protein